MYRVANRKPQSYPPVKMAENLQVYQVLLMVVKRYFFLMSFVTVYFVDIHKNQFNLSKSF